MRGLIVSSLVAAALVAAAPASAQRASLADRVTLLEQQAASNQGNMDLLNQLTQLRTEVRALRSQVEELQRENTQLQDSVRAQYLDVDGRLNRIESGAGGEGLVLPDPQAASDDAAPALPPAREDAEQAAGPALPAPSGDERAAYEQAFDALRAGQYADAASLFQDFLQQHPNGAFAANAVYWLGESYYVTQNYALAQEQFETLIARHPDSDKAPGALLKVGLSQYGQQELDAAEATLTEVGTRYPGTDAARTAEDRLRAIQIGRLR